jgi:hypothetical protein
MPERPAAAPAATTSPVREAVFKNSLRETFIIDKILSQISEVGCARTP